ncbi:transporter substrate-binding domain-containing protein [Streptomyces sp. OfavH-34-F]|uniref:transporter substrate-binding domain-containing protein n=1 Tax=Streptomyces sp. OfavH-34-F TaxID=2917760 RepID=UPI001EF36A3B|nr:transporter substrate-binding domain-containing protein [Streptomyces sp. OfavH-34-F]MCG7523566.1 transporter substrate-binding domain-containing protein [Streptomyces sp. OfavH-34-F]
MTRAVRHRRAVTVTAAVAAAALYVTATGCDSEPESILSDRTEVAAKSDQPGTSFSPHDGEYNGFDIAVVGNLMNMLGYETPRFSGVLSKNRAKLLHDGDVQLVAATFSITPNRMAPKEEGGDDLDFVGPYASTQQGFLIRDKDRSIRTLADLNGKVVCVWKGTTSANELSKPSHDRIVLRTEEDASYCVKALKEKEVDAVSTDQLILYGFQEANPTLRVVPGIRFGEPNDYGIAMAKGHRKDCVRLRDVLIEYVRRATTWERDFQNSLPRVPKETRDEAKPTEDEIMALSCVDRPGDSPPD